MKKSILFVVALSLFAACGNNSTSTSSHNVNVKVSESTDGWEYLESVEAARPASNRAKQDIHPASSGAILSINLLCIYMCGLQQEKDM